MTALAVVFMLLAMVIIWGGLTAALVFLVRHPLPAEDDDDAYPGVDTR